MTKFLLYAGLAITPFLFIQGYDSRYPKEFIAVGVALVIALLSIVRGSFKPFPNHWLMIFVGWAWLATFFAPHIKGLYLSGGGNVDGLWNYRPLFYITVYSAFIAAVASFQISNLFIDRIMTVMAFSGAIMAVYVCFQFVGLDPFFHVKQVDSGEILAVKAHNISGTLGQPTLVAPFILICIAPALYLKRYLMAALMSMAIILTQSHMAWVALACAIAFHRSFGNLLKVVCALMILSVLGALIVKFHGIPDSGRFHVWQTMFQDMKSNPLTLLFGFGFGSFGYLYSIMHDGQVDYAWAQAHSEYFEVAWGIGLMGMALMIKNFWWIFERSWERMKDPVVLCLGTSLFAACVDAAGNFIWHLGVFCLYCATMAGILIGYLQRPLTGGNVKG